jgi:hypothetical protein
VIVGLFEATDTFKVAMVAQMKELLSYYNLLNKLIACVKDKGGNLSTLAKARDAIDLCYARQETLELQGHVPDAHMWAICKMFTKIMFHVVKQCILNQTHSY